MWRAAGGLHEASVGLESSHPEISELDVEVARLFVFDQQEVLKLDVAVRDS